MHASSKGSDEGSQQSLFSLACDAAGFAPHVHPDELRSVRHSCAGRGRRDVVTCQDEYRDEFVDEVGTLDTLVIDLRGVAFPLDKFLPVVPRGMFDRNANEIPYPVVGVMLNDILTKRVSTRHGYYYLPEDTDINTEILKRPIFAGKHVILLTCGQDILIETLWWKRHELELFKKIASIGFLAVTGMNFSIFSGECPFSHALNTMKGLRYCEALDHLGVWAVPHIYAINAPQQERWKDWLNARPHIRLVTINTQLQRNRKRDIRELVLTVEYLLENTEVSILLHGRGIGLSPHAKKAYALRLHYAASGPLKSAVIRKDKSPSEYIQIFVNRLTAADW